MRELAGRTAFVTGGASGIGLALGRAFADAGMRVMLADIEADALAHAVESFASADVRGVVCDVTDAESVAQAAGETFAAFGKAHVLCNNAGVAGGGGIDAIDLASWRWVLDVNLMGVLNGLAAFLPHMRGHGEGGHIVNTASMAGLQSNLGLSPYAVSKYGVVAISEGLALELRDEPIGVSVVCPGFVQTRIGESARNRPARYGAAAPPAPGSPQAALVAHIAAQLEAGLDPARLAGQILRAIRDDEFYVFPHPEMRGEVDARFAAISDALGRAALTAAPSDPSTQG
jgi:NAD(P)-dependent dehydrogenase (short-subunit alcohol dehydrogenase family)